MLDNSEYIYIYFSFFYLSGIAFRDFLQKRPAKMYFKANSNNWILQ